MVVGRLWYFTSAVFVTDCPVTTDVVRKPSMPMAMVARIVDVEGDAGLALERKPGRDGADDLEVVGRQRAAESATVKLGGVPAPTAPSISPAGSGSSNVA